MRAATLSETLNRSEEIPLQLRDQADATFDRHDDEIRDAR